jgi:hypothetical protein
LKGEEPIEVIRWKLAEKFGWTLEYIDSLPVAILHEYLQIQDGKTHASGSILRK